MPYVGWVCLSSHKKSFEESDCRKQSRLLWDKHLQKSNEGNHYRKFCNIKQTLNISFMYSLRIYWQTVKFDEPFFTPPVVLTTVFNAAKGNKSNDGCSPKHKEPLITWMEVRSNRSWQPQFCFSLILSSHNKC